MRIEGDCCEKEVKMEEPSRKEREWASESFQKERKRMNEWVSEWEETRVT